MYVQIFQYWGQNNLKIGMNIPDEFYFDEEKKVIKECTDRWRYRKPTFGKYANVDDIPSS